MNTLSLSDINLLDVGNTICLTGSIWTSNDGKSYVALFPEFTHEDLGELNVLQMSLEDWEQFIRQSDLLETKVLSQDEGGLKKIIIRKTARVIDARMQWRVFCRDNYTCRYTGETGIPLSVDHIDLWENGGATIEDNLLAVSKKANKLRGSMPYEQWLDSDAYKKISVNLTPEQQKANRDILGKLNELRAKRVYHVRSR